MRALLIIPIALSVAACGSGSSSGAAAPPPTSPPLEPGGTPTTAQPTTPSQPSTPSTPSTPTTPTTPTTPPPPEPDRFVDVERLDQNPECDALIPAQVPAPVTIKVDSAGTGCGRGVSEGTGHVATQSLFTPRGTQWQVFGPDGKLEQHFTLTGELWPQPEGWQGVQAATSQFPLALSVLTFFADGSPRRSEEPHPAGTGPSVAALAPDPLGGSLVVIWGQTVNGPQCVGEARRYDATGAPAGGPGVTGCVVAAVGVSTEGEALVAERDPPSGTRLRWLRKDGTSPVTPTDDPNTPPTQLFPLLDGSLVGTNGLTYARRYPRLGGTSEAAPAWIAGRTNQTFRFTRGNKGYAFFPPSNQNSADCTQVVELVAPGGRRCATLTFRRDGNACVTGAIDQGWDGTVVQEASSGACGWRFWPGLLGGG